MKFTEAELGEMLDESGEHPLCGVCRELMAQLKTANEAIARLAAREPVAPMVNVSAPQAPTPNVQVAAPAAPNVTVNMPQGARVVDMTVMEREKQGPNEGMIKRCQFTILDKTS